MAHVIEIFPYVTEGSVSHEIKTMATNDLAKQEAIGFFYQGSELEIS